MSPAAISLIAFATIFCGMLFGMFLRTRLPDHHISGDSRDTIKLGNGMIAMMAALMLGMLTSSAKATYDTVSSDLNVTSSKIILLDRSMAHYGPETKEARDLLRHVITTTIERVWPEDKHAIEVNAASQSRGEAGLEELEEKLRQLTPQNDNQRQLQSRALQIIGDIAEARLHILQNIGQSAFPMPFLVSLVCWLVVVFFNFGLFTSRNTTVIIVLFICALSVSSSIFLLLELGQPYSGLIKISDAPLLNALARLGQ
jgi:hypothetical protein